MVRQGQRTSFRRELCRLAIAAFLFGAAFSAFIPNGICMAAVNPTLNMNGEVTVGTRILFGYYEQDNNYSNGSEMIEWEVLDTEGDKALLISKYALLAKPYNSVSGETTWEDCTLNEWLNNGFLKAAFSKAEEALIAETEVTADRNPQSTADPGNMTREKIFLLSISEAEKYFNSDAERICYPTEFAKYNGAGYADKDNGACWWWLRSPGGNPVAASFISINGSIYYRGDYAYNGSLCVRPALWLIL